MTANGQGDWSWDTIESTRHVVLALERGRWVAVCRVTGLDGKPQIRGRRFSSKSRARRFAKTHNGIVRRYRSAQWLSQPKPTAMVKTWFRTYPVQEIAAP